MIWYGLNSLQLYRIGMSVDYCSTLVNSPQTLREHRWTRLQKIDSVWMLISSTNLRVLNLKPHWSHRALLLSSFRERKCCIPFNNTIFSELSWVLPQPNADCQILSFVHVAMSLLTASYCSIWTHHRWAAHDLADRPRPPSLRPTRGPSARSIGPPQIDRNCHTRFWGLREIGRSCPHFPRSPSTCRPIPSPIGTARSLHTPSLLHSSSSAAPPLSFCSWGNHWRPLPGRLILVPFNSVSWSMRAAALGSTKSAKRRVKHIGNLAENIGRIKEIKGWKLRANCVCIDYTASKHPPHRLHNILKAATSEDAELWLFRFTWSHIFYQLTPFIKELGKIIPCPYNHLLHPNHPIIPDYPDLTICLPSYCLLAFDPWWWHFPLSWELWFERSPHAP